MQQAVDAVSGDYAVDQALAKATQAILKPIADQGHFNGIDQLFLSPDSELHRLPFAALPAPGTPSKRLNQAFGLRLLTTGRDLITLLNPTPPSGPSALLANPNFNAPWPANGNPPKQSDAATTPKKEDSGIATSAQASSDPLTQQRSASLKDKVWEILPGTQTEADALAPLLNIQQPLTGDEANTARLFQQQNPKILHIATHGYFQESQPHPQDTSPAPAAREDPLLRSGIVLAGANVPLHNPSDDGYLTAAEATSLPLLGTELVTLSACDTGKGSQQTGEGIYGLQRSLQVAGSRSTLLSLWRVDDQATAAFMQRFYEHLNNGSGRAQALAQTQTDFQTLNSTDIGNGWNKDWSKPAVWAAFQLTGDWRAIP